MTRAPGFAAVPLHETGALYVTTILPEPNHPSRTAGLPVLLGRVKLEFVSFRDAPDEPRVLENLSFEVAPGEIIGLLGSAGAGKTKMLRLLQRPHTPKSEHLLIDDINLNLMDATWLRRQIGAASQDTQLLSCSVRDNIAPVNPALGIQAVTRAAQLARLLIARALANNPRILLLDEAIAMLDCEGEHPVHDNLAIVAQGRTVFLATHPPPPCD